jgi:hypothetical protein
MTKQIIDLNFCPLSPSLLLKINEVRQELTKDQSAVGMWGTTEVTDLPQAVIDAGTDAYSRCDREYDTATDIVIRIYEAMKAAGG